MKKIIAVLLAIIMLLSLCACSNNTADNTDGGTTTNTESSTTGTEESTSETEETQKPAEGTNPTEGNKPTENTAPTTTPSSSSTLPPATTPPAIPSTAPSTPGMQECQHSNLKWDIPFDKTKPLPTCTESGYYGYWCDDCNIRFDSLVAALGHTGGTATCSSLATCTRCKQVYGELDTTKHVHTSSRINNAKNPTCEKDGYEGDLLYCNDCKTTLEKGAVLKALGHDLCQRWINEYTKYEVYCSRWDCDYSKFTDISPINFTFSDMGYEFYGIHTVSFDNPYFKIHITGGYLGNYGEYKIECFHENGTTAGYFVKGSGNVFSIEFHQYFRLGTAVSVVVSDNYGHSKTRKFTFVLDPTNEHKLIFKEIS